MSLGLYVEGRSDKDTIPILKTRDNPKIADRASVERIAAKSPTFRRFAEILGHPVSG